MAQLMPLPLTVSCFSKIQIGFTFLVPAHPGSPGKRAVKRVLCVSWSFKSGTSMHLLTSLYGFKNTVIQENSNSFTMHYLASFSVILCIYFQCYSVHLIYCARSGAEYCDEHACQSVHMPVCLHSLYLVCYSLANKQLNMIINSLHRLCKQALQ